MICCLNFYGNGMENNLLKEKKIVSKYEDGGINMIDFKIKCKAAILYHFKSIAKASDKKEF